MPKLKAEWIIESHDEFCVRCQTRKGGRFLIIHFDKIGVHAYMGVCEDCLKVEQ